MKTQQNISEIPIIDLSPYFNNQENRKQTAFRIRQTCKNVGFFVISNHGVPIELQQSIFKNAQKFFKLPKDEKRQIHMKKGGKGWRGYFQVGEQLTSKKIDLKQGLYLGQQLNQNHPKVQGGVAFHGPNLFPSSLPELKTDILLWLGEMNRLGDLVMQGIAQSLGLDRYFFRSDICKQHLGLLRLFHYPADDNSDPSLWAVGQHTDYGLITLLMISDKGLQVKNRNDEWINIDPIPNTFVVNIGDILQKMTRGLFKSSPHRVKNTQGRSRYSIPYFYDPDWNAEIKQLDIIISQDELDILKKTKLYHRWDEVNLETISGSYGQYLKGKISKVFPDLAKDNL